MGYSKHDKINTHRGVSSSISNFLDDITKLLENLFAEPKTQKFIEIFTGSRLPQKLVAKLIFAC